MIATIHALHGKGCARAVLCGLALFALIRPGHGASGPPQIRLHPADAIAREGERVTFSVQVDGTPPLMIQWERNGEVIGATGATFTAEPLTLSHDGDIYSITVTNALGAVTSSNAMLTVTPGIAIAASANRSADLVLYRGWPLVIEVALLHPDAFDSNGVPIVISDASGPWHNSLQLEVRDVQGQVQTWSFHAAPFTNETISLDSDSGARMLWWLTPTETTLLPLGSFEITATLNTTNFARPEAWKGILSSVMITLSILNEPATLDAAQQEQKSRLLADYALMHGDPLAAREEINTLLNAFPDNIGALTYNAHLKAAAGLFDEAYQSVQLALEHVVAQSPKEPPTRLLNLEAELAPIVAPPWMRSSVVEGQLQIEWDGHPFLSYRLQASSDLAAWSTIATNFGVTGNHFSATLALGAAPRFFRIVR